MPYAVAWMVRYLVRVRADPRRVVFSRGRHAIDFGLGGPAFSGEGGASDLPVAAVARDRDRAKLIGAQERNAGAAAAG